MLIFQEFLLLRTADKCELLVLKYSWNFAVKSHKTFLSVELFDLLLERFELLQPLFLIDSARHETQFSKIYGIMSIQAVLMRIAAVLQNY